MLSVLRRLAVAARKKTSPTPPAASAAGKSVVAAPSSSDPGPSSDGDDALPPPASSSSSDPSSPLRLRLRLLDLAESAALVVASSAKFGGKKSRRAVSDARRNAAAFWDRCRDARGERRWEGLCRALMDEGRTAALINELATSREGEGEGAADARAMERILRELAAGAGGTSASAARSMERVPWAEPLRALWADGGAARLPPPSSAALGGGEEDEGEWDDDGGGEGDADGPALLNDDDDALLGYYCLDPSSLLPVLALGLHERPLGDVAAAPPVVLDMCAAPGGKTLAALQLMLGPSSVWGRDGAWRRPILVANEPSRPRRERLRRVLDGYVPPDILTTSVRVAGLDGTAFGRRAFGRHMYDPLADGPVAASASSTFSHVLCDVPCSGERHLLSGSGGGGIGGALARWRPGSGRKNRARQAGLLKSAIAACRPGGAVVYSTCSVDPAENDGVVGKMLRKRADAVRSEGLEFDIGEGTEHGWEVLPDHPSCLGLGPMYIAKLRKME